MCPIIAKFTLTFNKVILKYLHKEIKIMLKFELMLKRPKNYLLQCFPSEINLTNFYRFAVRNVCLPVVLDALLQTMIQFNLKGSLKDRDMDPSSLHIIRVWELCRPRFWMKTLLRGRQLRSRFQLYLHLYKARRVWLKL